jgi:asparagine N-glycosylation enzyme membrane subunit Stt3
MGDVSPLLRRILLAGIVASALVWRLPSREVEWRAAQCDPDSLFHLHRVDRCLVHYPKVESIDPYSHYPVGWRIHWMAPLTWVYASVARLTGVRDGDLDGLTTSLSWIPPILGCLSVLLGAAVARCYADDDRLALAAAGLIAFDANCVRPFQYGFIDHHLYGQVAMLVLVLARLRRRLTLWIVGLALFYAMTPEATFYVALLTGLMGASEALGGALATGPIGKRWPWFLSPAIVAGAVLALQRSLETVPAPLGSFSWFYFSALHPLFIAGVGVVAGSGGDFFPSSGESRGRRLASLISLGGALIGLALLSAAMPGALSEILDKVLKGDRLFVSEEQFALGALWGAPWIRLVFGCGVLSAFRLGIAVWRREPPDRCFAWMVLVSAFLLGFLQFRFLYILSSLQMIGVAVLLTSAMKLISELPRFSSLTLRLLPWALAVVFFLSSFVTQNILPHGASQGDPCKDLLPVLDEVAGWLSSHRPLPAGVEDDSAAFGVISPWPFGHYLHVFGGVPVVTDPFNYEYAPGRPMLGVLREIWWCRTVPELSSVMRRYRARYLVLMAPAYDIAKIAAPDSPHANELIRWVAGDRQFFSPVLNGFAAFRLFMNPGLSEEQGSDGLELKFASAAADVYLLGDGQQLRIPKAQIYEAKTEAGSDFRDPNDLHGPTVRR